MGLLPQMTAEKTYLFTIQKFKAKVRALYCVTGKRLNLKSVKAPKALAQIKWSRFKSFYYFLPLCYC